MRPRYAIDVTTSRKYAGKNAVGIVRTEREIAKYYFKNEPNSVFFYYIPESTEFRVISPEEMPSILNDDPMSDDSSIHGKRFLKNGLKFKFQANDVVISAGLLWDFDYLSVLYREKEKQKLYVVQVLYDLIPVVMPEFCVPGMDRKFPKYAVDVAWVADLVLCISESTRSDFVEFVKSIDLPVPATEIIRLGDSFSVKSSTTDPRIKGIHPDEFVLFVSTIEPRKNHGMLFNIWRDLYDRYRDELVPLVWVGRRGWNVDNLISQVQSCKRLFPEKLKIIEDLKDENLAWMYQNAKFTVYPSMYEGWGLPITESLANNTVCLSSNGSSMDEAGRGLSDLIDPNDYVGWRDAIAKYMFDKEALSARKAAIRDVYTISKWEDCIEAAQTYISESRAFHNFSSVSVR